MKTITKLTLFISAFSLVSCNEKISPQLKDGNSSSVVPPTIIPSEYYFKVENTSPTIQNYRLHKTGLGNASAECKVSKTGTALSSAIYMSGDSGSDISCFFEAEELSLRFGGFSFSFSASPNTCEYIGYRPFSFFNRMPGSSSASLSQVICVTDTVTPALVLTAGGPEKQGGGVDCNEFVDDGLLSEGHVAGDRTAFIVENESDLCRFNYTDGDKEQCDTGTITITENHISHTPDDPATVANEYSLTREIKTKTVKCNGKAYNCVRGPIKKEANGGDKATMFTTLYQTVKNETFTSNREYNGSIQENTFNIEYTNFRRNISNTNVNYIDTSDPGYKIAFNGITDFHPNLMENYAANRLMNSNTYLSSSAIYNNSLVPNTVNPSYRRRPHAAEPFLGVNGYRVNPFYTFLCLDSAFEIKARIRMVVRDWDRVYSSNTSTFEVLSDIFDETNARIDNPGYIEIPYDPEIYNNFNDVGDWDDYILMSRTSGAYNSATTQWSPTSGFFFNAWFPNISITE